MGSQAGTAREPVWTIGSARHDYIIRPIVLGLIVPGESGPGRAVPGGPNGQLYGCVLVVVACNLKLN
jgi:hypothetical protein